MSTTTKTIVIINILFFIYSHGVECCRLEECEANVYSVFLKWFISFTIGIGITTGKMWDKNDWLIVSGF